MQDRTCATPGCERDWVARGLCGSCYGKAARSGTLPEKSPRHLLSNVDSNAKTAVCSICGPVGIRTRANGKSPECKTLRAASHKRYNKKHAQRIRYQRKYKLSLQDLRERSEAQMHQCLICDKRAKLVVDHDHKTGRFRGLICGLCNSALGFLGDSSETARAAAEYLERNGAGLTT